MSHLNKINSKIFSLDDLKNQVNAWKQAGEEVVFTNGCFDIIHRGHIEVLAQTADLGDRLIIGLNSDTSIQKLKGKNRPIIEEQSRAILLAVLSFVDAVILFSDILMIPYGLGQKVSFKKDFGPLLGTLDPDLILHVNKIDFFNVYADGYVKVLKS